MENRIVKKNSLTLSAFNETDGRVKLRNNNRDDHRQIQIYLWYVELLQRLLLLSKSEN